MPLPAPRNAPPSVVKPTHSPPAPAALRPSSR